MRNSRNFTFGIAAAAGLICLLVYLRALSCGFVNWEDQDYVLNNTAIRGLDSDLLKWAFTTMPLGFYFPLTWLSFALDYHFWGLNSSGYHLTNILLHSANTGLVVLVADALYKNRVEEFSRNKYLYPMFLLLSGLLFGIHPLRVESVAWVTERKDVLNGLFTLSSLLFYLRYQHKKNYAGKGSGGREYIFSLVMFALSLLSKPTSVVLPVLLLVMDWYPLGRLLKGEIRPIVVEKVPYLFLSMAITAATVLSNAHQGGFNPFSEFPFGMRLVASGNSLAEYFKLMIYPVGILPYYDLPKAMPQIFVVKAIAAAFFLCCSIYWGRKRPWVAAAMLFFVIPLLPVLQLSANGAQLILASRYTYIPSLLPCIIAAVLIATLYNKAVSSWSRYGFPLLTAMLISGLVFYVVETQRLIGDWKDSGAMWSKVIANQPFERAYFYRGLFYVDSGNYPAAVDDYTTCLTIASAERYPDIYNLYAFRGEALTKAGRYQDAVNDLSAAIAMFPHKLYYYHRGLAFKGLGNTREADEDFMRAGQAKGQMYWLVR